jgi:hypothetical protein
VIQHTYRRPDVAERGFLKETGRPFVCLQQGLNVAPQRLVAAAGFVEVLSAPRA